MIEIKDLYFNYKKGKYIYENLNLKIEKGQIYGILGENGVGKTTLLRIMAGLLFPKKGSCYVFGENAFKRTPEILEKMYFLPEEFYTPHVHIKQFVKDIGIFYPKFSFDQFCKLAKEFEVEIDRKFTELSYGQKKKVLISFALSTNADILFLDEPTNGLDIPSKVNFRKIIASEASEDKTFIISTHQVHDVENLLDRIMILERNAVLLNNTVEEITNKLKFSILSNITEKTIYSESCLGGFSIIELNEFNDESKINIESLFNATIKNKEQFKKLFNL